MDPAKYEHILERSTDIDNNNWTMMTSYAVAILGLCGGLRAKEIRFADACNLSFDNNGAKIFLIHVKGEDTYGQARTVPICLDGVPFIKRYVEARRIKLEGLNRLEEALIPPIAHESGYLSYNSLRKLKKRVEDDVGFSFDLRECRRTYGQNLIDIGADICDVQLAMGHSSPTTTFKNYCGKKPERAVSDLQRLWMYQQEGALKKP